MSQKIAGTFASTSLPVLLNTSDTMVIPSNVTSAKLTTIGLDASNTVKTQKSTNNGSTWADQTTYNSEQTNTAITVAHGEHWRLIVVSQQAYKQIGYSLSAES